MVDNKQFAHIGGKIKKLREDLGWSQVELARRAGVTGAAVNIIERHKRTPSLPVANRLAKAFQMPVSALIDVSEQSFSVGAELFYRKYGDILSLNVEDQALVLSMTKRLSAQA